MTVSHDPKQLSVFMAVAKEAVICASPTSLRYFQGVLDVEFKGDETPVTIADKETETVLREIIGKSFPEHGIYGEEHGQENMHSDYIWVLDPIDGTKSFISGMPLFGMLISLTYKANPILSVVHMPALGETFSAVVQGDVKPRSTRNCSVLSAATCFIGEADKIFEQSRGLYEKIVKSVRLARFGYDCYPYMQLAQGKIDVVIERNLQPYDFCALIPIVEQAGGTITDWKGEPLNLNSCGDVLACGDVAIHQQMLALIKERR